MKKEIKILQFVNWFPRFSKPFFWKPAKDNGMRFIYDWGFYLGFWEIRKWHKLKVGEIKVT